MLHMDNFLLFEIIYIHIQCINVQLPNTQSISSSKVREKYFARSNSGPCCYSTYFKVLCNSEVSSLKVF